MSPKTALAVGLKVDVDALPRVGASRPSRTGKVNLDDPAVTLALLKLNAVVGVKGVFDRSGKLNSVGIECALCHSTVDDSFAPGIGHRLDGWANRDLERRRDHRPAPRTCSRSRTLLHTDVATVHKVLDALGAGQVRRRAVPRRQGASSPTASSAATLIPPAFGLAGVNLHTWTGWGSIPYWNAFVAVLEMHGQGTFFDPRLDNAAQFPIAAENRFGHITAPRWTWSPRSCPALQAYQLSLKAPEAAEGLVRRRWRPPAGKALFNGKAECSTCHVPPIFTEPGWNLHPGSEIGIDNFQADRSPTHMYRTSPLAGLWTHQKGGFYHDGRFPDLLVRGEALRQHVPSGLTGPAAERPRAVPAVPVVRVSDRSHP